MFSTIRLRCLPQIFIINLICINLLTGNSSDYNIEAPSGEKLWAIAHRVNGEAVVNQALMSGANALEMDLVFTSEGDPTTFYHRCSCHCMVNIGSCPYLIGNYCEGPRNATEVMSYFMSHEMRHKVNMIYIDCKMGSVNDFQSAARNLIKLLEIDLFEKGYIGIAVIFYYFSDTFHQFLIEAAMKSDYQYRIFLVSEKDGSILDDIIPNALRVNNLIDQKVMTQARMNYRQLFFSAGTGLCFQNIQDLYPEVVLGRINTANGVFADVIVWTVNEEENFDKYYDMGTRGFITDNVEGFTAWATKQGYQLYQAWDEVPRGYPVRPKEVITTIGSCECGMSSTGCVITNHAPPFSACQCILNEYKRRCYGLVVGCRDISDIRCRSPDKTLASCQLGSGDCTGYTDPISCGCHSKGMSCETNQTRHDMMEQGCTCLCENVKSKCQGMVTDCSVISASKPLYDIPLLMILIIKIYIYVK